MTTLPDSSSAAGTVKKAISLPPLLAAAAAVRARAQQRNFSSYVQSLIARDLRGDETSADSGTHPSPHLSQ